MRDESQNYFATLTTINIFIERDCEGQKSRLLCNIYKKILAKFTSYFDQMFNVQAGRGR